MGAQFCFCSLQFGHLAAAITDQSWGVETHAVDPRQGLHSWDCGSLAHELIVPALELPAVGAG